uniref:Uncharacterized protein n=1 Tax=Candidatus Kentrum sp. FW TaxID=2126338 RepID=A0A450U3W1_9GAMM|nr:MAG: hypothetical protein BECKFW1821C_GA0114237_11487 [Candidatus Kentron sp. FW]
MIDGEAQFLQQTLGRFQVVHVGESLFQVREDGGVEIEGLAVFLNKAGGIVGHGLITRQGLVQGLGVAGVQRGQEFDAQEFGNLFEFGLFGCGIGIVRYESAPWRGLNQVMICRAKPREGWEKPNPARYRCQ